MIMISEKKQGQDNRHMIVNKTLYYYTMNLFLGEKHSTSAVSRLENISDHVITTTFDVEVERDFRERTATAIKFHVSAVCLFDGITNSFNIVSVSRRDTVQTTQYGRF